MPKTQSAAPEETCSRCNRPVVAEVKQRGWRSTSGSEFHDNCPNYARFYHDSYGCDSGCCGIRYEARDSRGRYLDSEFSFMHNIEEFVDWARERGCQIDAEDCDPGGCGVRVSASGWRDEDEQQALEDPDVRAIYDAIEARKKKPYDRDWSWDD